jgi:predicted DNA-binding transcriptional regulator YafY
MKIDRLLGITLTLLNKGNVTAKELARTFEVSTRTIYRDVDDLSAAGVPVFTNKGNNGGISLLENFVLDRSMLTEHEKDSLLCALQTLRATKYPEIETVLGKIGAIFKKGRNEDWVHIEFSPWGSGPNEENKFLDLKRAILERRVTVFDYLGSGGHTNRRAVEPVCLLFKSQAWYVSAYCRLRRAFRLFRVSRIKNLMVGDEVFERPKPPVPNKAASATAASSTARSAVTFKLRFQPRLLFRVYDDYNDEMITRNPDGTFDVTFACPEDEWVYAYILSFGAFVEVLEPHHVRKILGQRLKQALNFYR